MTVYAFVCNIPPSYHSKNLRHYFSSFIESGHFQCFNFRHRPQQEVVVLHQQSVSIASGTASSTKVKHKILFEKALCCLVKFSSETVKTTAIKKYHLQHWEEDNETLTERCILVDVEISQHISNSISSALLVLSTKNLKIEITQQRLDTFFELKPPGLMPQGNVGTPTKHFLNLINTCQLPSKLISKLGLCFPKSTSRKYGNVFFDYGDTSNPRTFQPDDEEKCGESSTRKIASLRLVDSAAARPNPNHPSSTIACEDEEEEEWDRHMALHDDVTEQERNKERIYEEEMEIVWEKGGPGIVWYTDAQYWKEAEGDFDEQTTDDWDVDYSVYFEENGGDKDARDAVEMRRSTRWRQGETESVFRKPQTSHTQKSHMRPRKSTKESKPNPSKGSKIVGPFEMHTRGIGRLLMERQGWREGVGLGKSEKGISQPIEGEGQKPRERKGLGYYGEELPRFGGNILSTKKRKTTIATVYDQPADTDPHESLLQRNPPTAMKYRY